VKSVFQKEVPDLKNLKENMMCANCGALLDVGQVEGQLPHVSTAGEIEVKKAKRTS
jgi:hypothetical protein